MALDKAAEEAKNVMCTRRSQFSAVAAALAGASMPSMAFAAEGTSTPWASRKTACGFRLCIEFWDFNFSSVQQAGEKCSGPYYVY